MKLHLTRSEGRNLFTGYGDGYVAINDQRHEHNIIVAPDRPVQPDRLDDLLADEGAEVITDICEGKY